MMRNRVIDDHQVCLGPSHSSPFLRFVVCVVCDSLSGTADEAATDLHPCETKPLAEASALEGVAAACHVSHGAPGSVRAPGRPVSGLERFGNVVNRSALAHAYHGHARKL